MKDSSNSGVKARVATARRYHIDENAPISSMSRIAALSARSLTKAYAIVVVIDNDRSHLVVGHGLPRAGGSHPSAIELSWEDGMAIIDQDAFAVVDAVEDPRTSGIRFLRALDVGFFAAAPILTVDGQHLGAIAVMDRSVGPVSEDQVLVLEDLAAMVMEQLEFRLSVLDAVGLEQRLRSDVGADSGEAPRDWDSLVLARDTAREERDQARHDRDEALVDRGVAERDRDLLEEYANVLQRTLLPPSLPTINGLQLACYFRPLSVRQIGGDFFDVFSLGDDRWAFFIGDVVGHGVEAAVVTSLIRYTLRSAALHYLDPATGLVELNAVLMREVAPRRFCTVHFGKVAPVDGGGFEVTFATGGHPPALLADPGRGSVEMVRPTGGMLVGAMLDATFDTCTVTVAPGQVLLFYTDGLIEAARGDHPFDEAALKDFVLRHADVGASGLAEAFAALVPGLNPGDDIAVLILNVPE